MALPAFGNWVVGCDNTLACTAIGLAPEEETIAYLRITREAGGDAEPIVAVAMLNEISSKGPVRLALPEGPLPVAELAVEDPWGAVASVPIGEGVHRAFLDALMPAERLLLALEDIETFVELGEMGAALRHMDKVQGRAGTITALVAKGEGTAAALSSPSPLPVIEAERLTEVYDSDPRPEGLQQPDALCDPMQPDFVLDAEGGTRLWGSANPSAVTIRDIASSISRAVAQRRPNPVGGARASGGRPAHFSSARVFRRTGARSFPSIAADFRAIAAFSADGRSMAKGLSRSPSP